MANSILLIGGHGMLARPVVRRLAEAGYTLRALARDPDKAHGLLPTSVEIVQGDLRDVDSIRRAAEGMDAVYINLSNPNPKSKTFRLEPDGTANVIAALKDRPEVLIAKVSALSVRHTGWWEDMDQKYEAEQAIQASGHPYLIFRPTWFFESLPLFRRKDTLWLFGRTRAELYWIAGDDFGRMVVEAFRQGKRDRIYNVQGPEAIEFDEAAARFAADLQENVKVKVMPHWMPGLLGLFSVELKQLAKLFKWTRENPETMVSDDTFSDLVHPVMGPEDYVRYMRETGDVPSR